MIQIKKTLHLVPDINHIRMGIKVDVCKNLLLKIVIFILSFLN